LFGHLVSPFVSCVAKYKRLICDTVLKVEVTDNATTIGAERLDKSAQPPATLVLTELVFLVQLSRIATRERIRPLEVRSPILPGKANDFTEFFGVSVRRGDVPQVRFSSADASRPFLTANESMWTFFEKELNKRLADLTESATMRDKVHAVLLELLPAGVASMDAVAKKLGVSSRTLHRRLKEEHLTFQKVLDDTREALAMHYLKSSPISGAEISFLLGYEDPNSFFRAFSGWTGTTPESARREMALVH
jgi:AraC-like DNA-binding protein